MRSIDVSDNRLGVLYGLTIDSNGNGEGGEANLATLPAPASLQTRDDRDRYSRRRSTEKERERELWQRTAEELLGRDVDLNGHRGDDRPEANLAALPAGPKDNTDAYERDRMKEEERRRDRRHNKSPLEGELKGNREDRDRNGDGNGDGNGGRDRAHVGEDSRSGDKEPKGGLGSEGYIDDGDREQVDDGDREGDASKYRHKKFRFKDPRKSSSRRRRKQEDDDIEDGRRPSRHHRSQRKGDDHGPQSSHRHHGHRHHHSSPSSRKKRKIHVEEKGYTNYKPASVVPDDPSAYDDTYLPNASSYQYADPDTAFRQSLFDAMADDEGATFWEGVYGQRIDIFPPPADELSTMTEDEYAAYVREKMYEKTHEYIFEERRKREERRKKEKETSERERVEWEKAEKERLRKEKARRERKANDRLKKRWDEYERAWSELKSAPPLQRRDIVETTRLENAIPWPVESAYLSDVTRSKVEKFYLASTQATTGDLHDLLKAERVKWHPDKVQQKWGNLSEKVLRAVNTIFQTVDSLWAEYKEKKTMEPL